MVDPEKRRRMVLRSGIAIGLTVVREKGGQTDPILILGAKEE